MKVCLVLTHQCNLGCSYCYAGEKFRSNMSLETGLQSLKLAFSRPGPLEISFFGGEPMIAFDSMARLTRVAASLARRQRRSLRFSVTTNATILQEHHLRFLKHYDFYVGLSIDGLEEEHDKHRPFVGGRGSGELVWRNLETACQMLGDFRVLMVVRPDTVARLPQAIERMYRLGVERISLLPDVEADWAPAQGLLQEVYARLARISYLSTLTDQPLFISPFTELLAGEGPHVSEKRSSCGFGSDELAVSPAGNFYPCARLVGTDKRPEVRIGDLARGLDHGQIDQLQRSSRSQLSACGSGGCECLALMPGDTQFQLANLAIFTNVAALACEEAARTLEEVAA